MKSSYDDPVDNGPLLWHHLIASISFNIIMKGLKVLDYKYHIVYVSKNEWKPIRVYCSYTDKEDAIEELEEMISSMQCLNEEVRKNFNFELTVMKTSIVGTTVYEEDITPPSTEYTYVNT